MIAEKTNVVSPTYSTWVGKSVVLLIVLRQCHLPVPCSIVAESVTDVRIRIKPGWEMNVRKELILAVEENIALSDSRSTGNSAHPA